MPRLLTTKADMGEVMVCAAGFAIQLAAETLTISEGQRMRADHPAVLARPELFVHDGATADEVAEVKHALVRYDADLADDDGRTVRVPDPIPDAEAAVAATAFTVVATGRFVEKGCRLRRDDPLVRAHPEHFRTPPMPLAAFS